MNFLCKVAHFEFQCSTFGCVERRNDISKTFELKGTNSVVNRLFTKLYLLCMNNLWPWFKQILDLFRLNLPIL